MQVNRRIVSLLQSDVVLRAADLFFGTALFMLSLPLFILALYLVKLDGVGSVFYAQERYGRGKKRFSIYKFRTMKDGSENGKPVWGTENDPRCSLIGKFLRITHIDELPQLFNVFMGQMSLVGPRPERPYFADDFELLIPEYSTRYAVKPGMTGWSQVNGYRGDSSIEERTKYDVFYINNRSISFYLKIALLTLWAKPIKIEVAPEAEEYDYSLVFSQVENFSGENIPCMVPIRKA